ncbi:MAG: TadE/TadG family type IV pilus assembly protein [Chloroflexota bacterium]
MSRLSADERGQAAIEFALALLAFLTVTVGLIDVGRSIFAYNELSAVARYGARWGSVVGGTCNSPLGASSNDWCDQLGNIPSLFWQQGGNAPGQVPPNACPSYTPGSKAWYKVSDYSGSKATTIVGAIAQHLDTSRTSTNTVVGAFAPGLDLSKLWVCIELPDNSPPAPGDSVKVNVYYPWSPSSGLITNQTVPLTANAQWEVE